MRDRKLKKNSFINGALFVTLGIIFTKILGVLYVIPFHSLIGERGGALYGYAYSIYVFFISLSTAGIPLAISKIISEYNTLGNYDAKVKAFKLGRRLALLFGFISFLILNIFASRFASLILGDLHGGNTIQDVSLVIRIISTAILVVPVLSIYRGYFQGHRYMEPPSNSQVIEQLVRILIIIIGSFLVLKVFKLSIATAVGVAVFGATAGALSSYFYLVNKMINNKNKFKTTAKIKINVTNKEIIKKIFYYAFPLVMIDVSKSIYNFIDTFTVVNGLVKHANYSVGDAEVIMSMLSTWATKFNMIISSVATGIVVSLTPNLTSSLVKDLNADVNNKINQAIGVCLFLTIPMTFGIAFLAKPIWTVFYGYNEVGSILLGYFIFTGLLSSLFTVVITIIQLFKKYKALFISLIIGVFVKVIFNTQLISSFYRAGFPPYYGVITATILGYLFSIIFGFVYLGIKAKINFEKLIGNVFDIMCGSILMSIVLVLIRLIIPFTSTSRIINLILILLFGIIGVVIYLFYMYKNKTIDKLFGKDFISKVKKEIIR